MPTILDVLDNFFGPAWDGDVLRVPGKRLMELGREVRRFADSYELPQLDQSDHPTYIGGWPSANICASLLGRLTLASLLYSGYLVARDPISDWFAKERYQLPLLLRARPGYLTDSGASNVAATRQYLSVIVPALNRLRPLIESGALVLVPARRMLYERRRDIAALHEALLKRLGDDPRGLTLRFRADDLTVEDNVKGLFVFAGGNREEQILHALDEALEFFAGEYHLAHLSGAEYAAPFRFEQFVCQEGLAGAMFQNPGDRVVHAILGSQFPLFSGLTPEVVATVRNDESFGEFRAGLYQVYRDIPVDPGQGSSSAIAEAEAAVLAPAIERVRRELRHGALAKAGLRLAGHGLRMAIALEAVHTAAPKVPLLPQAVAAASMGLTNTVLGLSRRQRGSVVIWKKLYAHHQRLRQEVAGVQPQGTLESREYWGIPELPSLAVHVSPGLAITDFVPRFALPEQPGSYDNPYGPCACGSGIKFKFCCAGVTS